jgi:hypothetical protein
MHNTLVACWCLGRFAPHVSHPSSTLAAWLPLLCLWHQQCGCIAWRWSELNLMPRYIRWVHVFYLLFFNKNGRTTCYLLTPCSSFWSDPLQPCRVYLWFRPTPSWWQLFSWHHGNVRKSNPMCWVLVYYVHSFSFHGRILEAFVWADGLRQQLSRVSRYCAAGPAFSGCHFRVLAHLHSTNYSWSRASVFFYVLTVAFDVPGRWFSNRQFFEAVLSTSWFGRSVGFQWAGVGFCCTFAPVFLHKRRPILMFEARSAFRALFSGHLQNIFSDASHSHWWWAGTSPVSGARQNVRGAMCTHLATAWRHTSLT